MDVNERQVAIDQLNQRYLVSAIPFSKFKYLDGLRHTHGLRVIGSFDDYDEAREYIIEAQKIPGLKLPDGYIYPRLPIFPEPIGDSKYDRWSAKKGIHVHIVDTFVTLPKAFSKKAVATK